MLQSFKISRQVHTLPATYSGSLHETTRAPTTTQLCLSLSPVLRPSRAGRNLGV